jgi:hypothetical protein
MERRCREGGDLSGDEEEASREEGCSEEKAVTLFEKWLRWGRHPPAGLILYFIWVTFVKGKNYILFYLIFSNIYS